jgi:hypothetical protein
MTEDNYGLNELNEQLDKLVLERNKHKWLSEAFNSVVLDMALLVWNNELPKRICGRNGIPVPSVGLEDYEGILWERCISACRYADKAKGAKCTTYISRSLFCRVGDLNLSSRAQCYVPRNHIKNGGHRPKEVSFDWRLDGESEGLAARLCDPTYDNPYVICANSDKARLAKARIEYICARLSIMEEKVLREKLHEPSDMIIGKTLGISPKVCDNCYQRICEKANRIRAGKPVGIPKEKRLAQKQSK